MGGGEQAAVASRPQRSAHPPGAPVPRRSTVLRLLRNERQDPEPFYRAVAARTFHRFPFPLAGRVVLDLGAGPGHFSAAIAAAGGRVIALEPTACGRAEGPGCWPLRADGSALPLRSEAVDGVFCSNVLEHTPEPAALLDEMARVLRPGGWAWVSWTRWWSPWGG